MYSGSAKSRIRMRRKSIIPWASALLRTQGCISLPEQHARWPGLAGMFTIYFSGPKAILHNIYRSFSTTGLAGPGPSETGRAVYVACRAEDQFSRFPVRTLENRFHRKFCQQQPAEAVRRESVEGALDLLLAVLRENLTYSTGRCGRQDVYMMCVWCTGR